MKKLLLGNSKWGSAEAHADPGVSLSEEIWTFKGLETTVSKLPKITTKLQSVILCQMFFIYITLIFLANLKHKYNNSDFRNKEIEAQRS